MSLCYTTHNNKAIPSEPFHTYRSPNSLCRWWFGEPALVNDFRIVAFVWHIRRKLKHNKELEGQVDCFVQSWSRYSIDSADSIPGCRLKSTARMNISIEIIEHNGKKIPGLTHNYAVGTHHEWLRRAHTPEFQPNWWKIEPVYFVTQRWQNPENVIGREIRQRK